MLNLLLKSGLSLALLSSLTISDNRTCASNNQSQNLPLPSDSHCCLSHEAPDHYPARPASSDDCQCSIHQVLATSKSRLPEPDTGISTSHDSSLPAPFGLSTVATSHHFQANSRPLYLIHCADHLKPRTHVSSNFSNSFTDPL